jgi:RecB family exonuclease
MSSLPGAREIGALSPSRAEALHTCPLQVAFAQSAERGGTPSDAARLGTICHSALESLVSSSAIFDGSWKDALSDAWQGALDQDAKRNPGAGPPRRWTLARARLPHVVGEVAQLLAALPPGVEVLSEVNMTSRDGLLTGRADLVARGESFGLIVDFKTGAAIDNDTHDLRDSYGRQLKLYAYLDHEATGVWPSRAVLVPFVGAPVELLVDPDTCAALADAAREARTAYNALVPAAPPANASPSSCIWCAAAPACPAFWERCDPTWAEEGVQAARGRVKSAQTTPMGGVVVRLDATEGTVAPGEMVLRGVDTRLHDALNEPGSVLAAVGIRPNGSPRSFQGTPHLRIAVEAA